MSTSLKNPALGRSRKQVLSLPDMAPFASVVFLMVCFYMLTGHFKTPEEGIVSNEDLPLLRIACWRTPVNSEAVICLNSKNQFSFSSSPAIQTDAIQKVALQHGIQLTPPQLARLKALPFLATTVENLPELLSLQDYQYRRAMELSKRKPLSEQQLIECMIAAKASAKELTHKPIYTCLKIGSEVKMLHAERLFDLLQAHDIHRFLLKTRYQ